MAVSFAIRKPVDPSVRIEPFFPPESFCSASLIGAYGSIRFKIPHSRGTCGGSGSEASSV